MRLHHIAAGLLSAASIPAVATAQDALSEGFRNPPVEAHPRVWWHWMNGNITEDGIAKDLAWMKRIGIAGVQTFDANLATPQMVDKRLVYMTPEWKKAFRYATETADKLGLELAIAASPGWSETGGPWVQPEDGIKKLVWSEVLLPGGKRFSGRLPSPPANAGPFQEIPAELDAVAASTGDKQFEAPALYRDVGIFAYQVPATAPLAAPRAITVDGAPLDIAALSDASLETAVPVSRGSSDKPTTIVVEYDKAQVVRSLSFFAPSGAEKFGAPHYLPYLETSEDGNSWKKITDLALTPVPTTVSFSPVTARLFRLVLAPNPNGGLSGFAPAAGVDLRPVLALLAPKPNLPIAELKFSSEPRVHQFEVKAGYSTALGYAPLEHESDGSTGPGPADVVNLTDRMSPDGSIDWTPPKGRWRVVRMGWSLTGKTNHPAPLEATGLEVDKLDGQAVRRYLERYMDLYRDTVGEDLIGKRGISAILTDSTEAGAFNWTPRMVEQFTRLRGYNPTPWLPVLTGALVGSRAQSDGFLRDYRQTIADLHASEHYGTVAAFAHENGLKVYGEALEDRRPSLGDDMAMRRYADFPMAALWTWPRGQGPRPTLLGDMRGASSVAHIYGQNIAAAESMTSAMQYWAHSPSDLRRIIDLEFANGINRPIIHSSVHQPVDDKKPGAALMIFGQYFNRHETWAEMAKPWVDYIARNSFMLQQGRNVADVAYFYGEDSPLTALFAEKPLADVPTAYAYDFVNSDALLNVLKVEGSELVAPSGARYRVLYLGGTSARMTLPVLRRIAELVTAGATVVGDAPTGSPGLVNDPAEYRALVAKLWSGESVTKLGTGSMIAGTDVETALQRMGVAPDFAYTKPAPDTQVLFVHRELADGHAYFVNNRLNRPEVIEGRFRVTGQIPELWRADTGKSEQLSYRTEGDVTVVPLEMAAEDSFYVVFRAPTTAPSAVVTRAQAVPIATLSGPWTVTFEPGRGAPASIHLAELASLISHSDPGVKYFSGSATYTSKFSLPREARPGQPLLLDLGNLGDIAKVKVNGRAVGTVWHAPFRMDVGDAVKRGSNTLEVTVANLWVNRLIGDAQPDAEKVTYSSISTYTANAPLRPAGLLGPVQLFANRTP